MWMPFHVEIKCVRPQKPENNVSSVCVPERPQTQSRLCDHADTNVSLRITHTLWRTQDIPGCQQTQMLCVCVCVCVCICLLCTCVSVLPTQYVSFAMVGSPHVLFIFRDFPSREETEGGPKNKQHNTHRNPHTLNSQWGFTVCHNQ